MTGIREHIRLVLCTLALGLAVIIGTAWALDPGVFDISMQAGEDYRLQLTLKDGNGAAMNLTGYSYRAQFRQAPAPTGALYATYSTVMVSPTTGRLDVRLSKAQTNTNTGRSGVWDLQQTEPGGNVSYILTGKTVVKPTATR